MDLCTPKLSCTGVPLARFRTMSAEYSYADQNVCVYLQCIAFIPFRVHMQLKCDWEDYNMGFLVVLDWLLIRYKADVLFGH